MTNKERYISLLQNTMIKGVSNMIEYLEQNGFFEAPASGGHHLSQEGGLCEHSLNVYDALWQVTFPCGTFEDKIIVALLHDVGKMGFFDKPMYEPNVLASGKLSASKPYETNKSIVLEHQDLSLMICSKFIELTNDQAIAIKYHNGLYTKDGYQIMGKETKLMLALHFADMWCSRFVEV